MIDFGASGRMAGVSLLALAVGLTAAVTADAKDIPGRKRCFVAGVETYKEEPVYRDKSSGYQRVQVPGSKGERCFWEPLNYQAAAAAAPMRPSRAAPSTSGRRARAESKTTENPSDSAAPKTGRTSKKRPQAGEPQNLAALPPQPQSRSQPAPRPQPQPEPEPQPEPQPQPQPEPQPEPQPQPESQPQPQPQPESQPQPEPQPQTAPEPRSEPAPRPQPRTRPRSQPEPAAEPRSEPKPQPQPQPEPEPQGAPEPRRSEMPSLSPRGLNSGSSSSSQDLRIATRPVTSGGALSTASSGPEIQSLTKDDRVVPVGEPMQSDAAREAMASLSPRTAVRGSSQQAAEPSAPPPAEREARPASSSRSDSRPAASAASQNEGGSFVQLGSVPSHQKAKQFWTDVTGRYPEVLSGFSPNIVEAEIPGKGTWYRVRVGPFESGEAKALCKRLEGNCLVVSQ